MMMKFIFLEHSLSSYVPKMQGEGGIAAPGKDFNLPPRIFGTRVAF